jgi:glycosyltransferase involved in cell wall biosynthesis
VYVDPSDATGTAAAMAVLAADPPLRRELGERGRRRAADFSWAVSARHHVDAYSSEMLRSWRPTSWMKRSMLVGMQ